MFASEYSESAGITHPQSVSRDEFSTLRIAILAINQADLLTFGLVRTHPSTKPFQFWPENRVIADPEELKIEIVEYRPELNPELHYKPGGAGSVVGSILKHLSQSQRWIIINSIEKAKPEPLITKFMAVDAETEPDHLKFLVKCLALCANRIKDYQLSILRPSHREIMESIRSEDLDLVTQDELVAYLTEEINQIPLEELQKMNATTRASSVNAIQLALPLES